MCNMSSFYSLHFLFFSTSEAVNGGAAADFPFLFSSSFIGQNPMLIKLMLHSDWLRTARKKTKSKEEENIYKQ